ncbi:MAG: sodium:proton antiporter NhaD [Bacteroidetes bacterium]|nr:sodium:proton antiporter NhaD [Bacteroidota bacterium]
MTALLIIVFVIGYFFIVVESWIKINKTATSLLTGVLCWVILSGVKGPMLVIPELGHHLSSLSEILFFLLGAMTIVELVDAHQGFDVIVSRISTTKKVRLLWIVSLLAFFLSAILDNLTTAIVMVSLIRKLIQDKNDRMLFAGMIIIGANAGGAWSPIGDVTTTMLWIGGQISALNIVLKLFLPSLICLLTPLIYLSFRLKGNVQTPVDIENETKKNIRPIEKNSVFFAALTLLFFVPVFKLLTGMPPYMGILLGLSLLWILTEILHKSKNSEFRAQYSVAAALQRIDVPSILFFLGILLAITALESAGILGQLAVQLNTLTQSKTIIALTIGVLSAVVDNVPLVAASMGMYDFKMDDFFWEFIAYCAGTGGSILIIGSAAGVAAMGMEKIEFGWYLKKIGGLALAGYLAGAAVYLITSYLF